MQVLDHGTIVGLMVRKSDGSSFFINMDHRMFHHFAGDYDYRLIGMKVSYDGEQLYPVDTNPIAGRNPASRAKGHHCIDCGRYLKYGIPVDFYGQKAYKCVSCYYAGPMLSKMKPRLTNPRGGLDSKGRPLSHSSGRKMDYSDLDDRFTPYYNSGERIEVEWMNVTSVSSRGYGKSTGGTKERFYVGKSTGWKPVYLAILKKNSLGGSPLSPGEGILSIRGLGKFQR